MIVGAFLWALVGASVVMPRNLVRIYPRQTAFLRVSPQFPQPEWEYFHVHWKFLTKNSPILYCAVECNAGPDSAHRTCKRTVEKGKLYEAQRVDIEEDGSLVLRDVRPEDAGKYERRVFALDVFATAEVELVVVEDSGRDLSLPGTHQPQQSTRPVGRKGAWDHARSPTTGESQLPTKEGLPSSESVSLPPRAISAAVNHTAWLPITLQSLGPAWTFLSIKWELITTNRSIPVLLYLIGNCSSRTVLEWWEKECSVHKEVAGEYQQRVDVFRNGTLVIYSVGLKDAGIYQATLRASGVKVQAVVNLTVTQGTSGSLHRENMSRIILAGLLLFFLGLLVGEHVWVTSSPRPASQPGKGGRDPLRLELTSNY